MRTAPFYDDLADGPANGAAYWLTAKDGVQLRIGVWSEGAQGTVLLFPGRTEYIEKYGRAAEDLRKRGFATVAVDWRGQGLADRPLANRNVGHVADFDGYQQDIQAVLAALPALNLPQPFFLIGHSMGGCIGLRALMNGLPVAAASFSGPMWDIRMSPAARSAAWAISTVAHLAGLGDRFVPGTTGSDTYVKAAPFEGNELTTDPEMYAYMQRQVAARPELALGGPSLTWIHQALREIRDLRKQPSPDVPTLTFLGSDEMIVSPDEIIARMARWPNGRLETVPGCRHEVMMEAPEMRALFFDQTAAHFRDAAAVRPETMSA